MTRGTGNGVAYRGNNLYADHWIGNSRWGDFSSGGWGGRLGSGGFGDRFGGFGGGFRGRR
jgi:hypothetical protein